VNTPTGGVWQKPHYSGPFNRAKRVEVRTERKRLMLPKPEPEVIAEGKAVNGSLTRTSLERPQAQ